LRTALWGGVAIFALLGKPGGKFDPVGSTSWARSLREHPRDFSRRVFSSGARPCFAALVSETLVLVLFYSTKIGYLWHNLIRLRLCAVVCNLERGFFRTS
jgi:hypothetical protein